MKILFFYILLLSSSIITAQLPVTDVATSTQLTDLNLNQKASNTTLASQLSTAGSQLTQLEKTYEQIQKASDKIEKVNDAIKSVDNVETFIKQQKEIIRNINIVGKSGKKNVNFEKAQFVLNSASRIVSNVQNILSDGFFNLNDKERVDLLDKQKKEMAVNLVRSRLMLQSVK